MRVISRRKLLRFWRKHPQSESSLTGWYKIVSNQTFMSFADLRETFPTADLVNKFVVFNIAGNKYRLITAIHFNTKTVYLRHILTHAEYDKGRWKK